MTLLGKIVKFDSWDDDGQEITRVGVVEWEGTEPREEDSLQRTFVRVRGDSGDLYTPYADECRAV